MEVLSSDLSVGTLRLEATLLPGSTGFVLHVQGRDEQERASFLFTREFPVPPKSAEYLENSAGQLAVAFSATVSAAAVAQIAGWLKAFAKVIRGGSPAAYRQRVMAQATDAAAETQPITPAKPTQPEPPQFFSMGEYRPA